MCKNLSVELHHIGRDNPPGPIDETAFIDSSNLIDHRDGVVSGAGQRQTMGERPPAMC